MEVCIDRAYSLRLGVAQVERCVATANTRSKCLLCQKVCELHVMAHIGTPHVKAINCIRVKCSDCQTSPDEDDEEDLHNHIDKQPK